MKKENKENKINDITLTSQNKKERPFGIGGSDANKLVNGNWIDLYDEKKVVDLQIDIIKRFV